MTPSRLYFTLDQDLVEDDSRVWVEVIQGHLFDSYLIQSWHADSEILLHVNIEHVCRALRSATNCTELVMKLTKKNSQPYLDFKIGTMSSTGVVRPITQDIPVTVCPAEDIEAVKPPQFPIANVNIYLPDVRMLKNVVERMKAISHVVTVRANMEGEFELLVENDVATVRTHFKNLENPPFKEGQAPADDVPASQFFAATIDTRRLLNFIQAAQNFADQAHMLMSISTRVVVLFLLHDDMNLSYIVPIRSS
eukprot:m.10664 g.10664  ORF g.10664 m.10664 type:complete len:251 (+) comp6663_c0_seq1:3-755(+)